MANEFWHESCLLQARVVEEVLDVSRQRWRIRRARGTGQGDLVGVLVLVRVHGALVVEAPNRNSTAPVVDEGDEVAGDDELGGRVLGHTRRLELELERRRQHDEGAARAEGEDAGVVGVVLGDEAGDEVRVGDLEDVLDEPALLATTDALDVCDGLTCGART